MIFYLDRLLETWLLPPGFNLLFIIVGFFLLQHWPMTGKTLIVISFVSLWLLSTPFIAQKLINGLQYQYPTLFPNELKEDKSAAIVVLEAGLNLLAPEFGNKVDVAEGTLARLRYAAFLHKKTGARILVSGNDPTHPLINQADYMANALHEYFDVATEWREDKGFNTAQEGILTANMLKHAGVNKIYLVTHAEHMPRAMYAFQNKQLEVIPAPTRYISIDYTLGYLSLLLPTLGSLNVSTVALHEYIGLLWYKIYYRF